jgi:protein gp37
VSVTNIEWADRVWNPVTGCTKVSAGCKNCYAEAIADRFWKTQYPPIEYMGTGLYSRLGYELAASLTSRRTRTDCSSR